MGCGLEVLWDVELIIEREVEKDADFWGFLNGWNKCLFYGQILGTCKTEFGNRVSCQLGFNLGPNMTEVGFINY